MQISDDQLRNQLLRTPHTRDGGDTFFGQFSYVAELYSGNYSEALNQGLLLLVKCEQLEPVVYKALHKGTPYYWLGVAAFQVHDYQTATFFFDAGVSEDLRAGSHPTASPTPGLRFLQIEGNQPGQAAMELVAATQKKVERAVLEYNRRAGRSSAIPDLQLDEIRLSFLRPAVSTRSHPWRTLATAFISFFLEWDYRSILAKLGVSDGTLEPLFLHLFKGCLLFESLLKANQRNSPPPGKTLGPTLQHVHKELGIPNDLTISNVDFQSILAAAPVSDDSIRTAIEFAGKVRNTVGHDLGWIGPLEASMYDRLAGQIGSACLHAIACLYR